MQSMHDGPEMARSSQSVGAQGVVTRKEANEVLLKAVAALLAGGTFLPERSRLDKGLAPRCVQK
jgi:DNA-binding NarL/FixJ family response regulator